MGKSEEEVTFVKLQKFEDDFFFVLHFCTFLNGTSFYATEVLTHSSKSQALQYFYKYSQSCPWTYKSSASLRIKCLYDTQRNKIFYWWPFDAETERLDIKYKL